MHNAENALFHLIYLPKPRVFAHNFPSLQALQKHIAFPKTQSCKRDPDLMYPEPGHPYIVLVTEGVAER